jgi:tetratricopeptide (TPR) repeat protein
MFAFTIASGAASLHAGSMLDPDDAVAPDAQPDGAGERGATPRGGEGGRTSPIGRAAGPGKTGPMEVPERAPGVTRLLEAGYLTPEEGKDLRVFHGVWIAADLDTPVRRAHAALVSGRLNDPSLAQGGDGPTLDRAEALQLRGRLAESLAVMAAADPRDRDSIRAGLIGARVLEQQGKSDQAIAVAEAAFVRLGQQGNMSPLDLVNGVMLSELHMRLKGPASAPTTPAGEPGAREQAGAGIARNFDSLMKALQQAREDDRLFWPARLAEAELLVSRGNPAQGQEALVEVLALNPRCARAWELLGRMTINSFSLDSTERVAQRLEQLMNDTSDAGGGATQGTPGEAPAAAGIGKVNLAAQLLRARAMLRQTNGEQAEAMLESVPVEDRSVEWHALSAAAAAVRFDFDRADQALNSLDAAVGGPTFAGYLETGAALAEARQYEQSARFLAEAARRQPFNPDAFAELGLMELQAGRDEPSQAALEQAHTLDPFNVRVDNTLRLVRELRGYARVESDHFVVRCKPGVDRVLAEEMLPALERIYSVVTGSQPGGIDFAPPGVDNKGKTVIDLMPDHEWFGVRIAGMPQIHTIAASTGPVIAMEAPREGPGHLGAYDWVRTVRHEFTHTVSLARTKNRIPLWYTEAAAQYLELAPKDYPTVQLLARALDTDTLFDFDQINIAFVRPKKPSDRAQGYAQGLWMYEYMIERWGPKTPLKLMDQYALGVREEAAFQNVLGLSREQFATDFKAWAGAQVVAWGMEPPQGQPRISELLAAAVVNAPQREPGVSIKPTPEPGTESDAAVKSGAPDVAGVVTPERIEEWLRQYPNHPDVLELAVIRSIEKTDGKATAENAPLVERYSAARPVDPMPHRLLAQMYLSGATPEETADIRRAVEHLEFLDQREQYTPTYAMELARRYQMLKEWAKAGEKAERAVSIAPYDARPRELAATIAIQMGDLTAAERHIVALTRLEPDREIHKKRLEALRGRMKSP